MTQIYFEITITSAKNLLNASQISDFDTLGQSFINFCTAFLYDAYGFDEAKCQANWPLSQEFLWKIKMKIY